ncbi:hypothetical protein KEM55_007273 [Ascosphaera atra]|nr:hypothetical protein KEM55_007273 [Ascosphaera atra]
MPSNGEDTRGRSPVISDKKPDLNQPTEKLSFRRPTRDEVIKTIKMHDLSYEELDALFYLLGLGGPNGIVFDSDEEGRYVYEYSALAREAYQDRKNKREKRTSKL